MEGCFPQFSGPFDTFFSSMGMVKTTGECAKTTGLGSFTLTCADVDGFGTAYITPTVDVAVIMKGGPGGTLFSLKAGTTHTLDVGSRKAISHIEFCFVCNGCGPTQSAPVTTSGSVGAPTSARPVTAAPFTSGATRSPTRKPSAAPATAAPGPGNSGSMKRGLEVNGQDKAGNFPLLDDIGVDDGSTGVECRVAFAYHSAQVSHSFADLGLGIDFENTDVAWGWTNGPLVPSNYEYSFELYSEDKETKMGTMNLNYDDEAVVTIEAGDRLWLKSVNAYVGHSRLPVGEDSMEIVDPAQFPVAHDKMSLSRSFKVSELDGSSPIYVVAEVTVCGAFHANQQPYRPQSFLEAVTSFFRRVF
jgi:hypothetical protein